MSLKLLEQTKNWIEANPLRRWRIDARELGALAQTDIAILIGKSAQSVRNYETGSYQPTAETMKLIASVMGKSVRTVTKEWNEWLKKRPTP